MKRLIIVAMLLMVVCMALAEVFPVRPAEILQYIQSAVTLSDGSTVAIWDQADAHDFDVYGQKFNPNGESMWNNPKPLASGNDPQCLGKLLATSDNGFIIFWNTSNNMLDFFAQKFNSEGEPVWSDGGHSFPLGNASSQVFSYLANSVGGYQLVVYNAGDARRFTAYSFDGEGNPLWGSDGIIISTATYAYLDKIVSDGNGGLIACIQQSANSQLIRISQQGTIVGNNPMIIDSPLDGRSYKIFALANNRYVLYNWNSSDDNLCFNLMDLEGNLLMAEPLLFSTGIAITPPKLAASPEGGFYAVFGYYAELRLIRFSASGSPVWQPWAKTISDGVGNVTPFNLTSNPSGEAVLVWTANNPKSLKAQKVSPAGVLQWSESGIVLTGETREQALPSITLMGNNYGFIWRDKQESHQMIRIQTLNQSGNPLLTPGGSIIAQKLAGEITYFSQLVTMNNSYYSFWQDKRDNTYKLYMQKFDADFNPQWEASGRAFNPPHTDHEGIIDMMVWDNSYIVILYQMNNPIDYGSGVYVQKLNSAGERLYPERGIYICGSFNTGKGCKLSYDNGDLFVMWGVGNSNFSTIKGQRIRFDQALWEPEGRIILDVAYGVDIAALKGRFLMLRHEDTVPGDTGNRLIKFSNSGATEPGWPEGGMEYFSNYDSGNDYIVDTAIINDYLYVVVDGWEKDFIQKVGMDGSLPWGLDAVTLHPEANNHGCQAVVFGADIYFLFVTNLDSSNITMYIQKATYNGELPWGIAGRAITTSDYNLVNAKLMLFASGDITALWTFAPHSSDNSELMHCLLDSQGNLLSGIAPLCNAPYDQGRPMVSVNGNRGMVIWADQRHGYAMEPSYPIGLYAASLTAGQVGIDDPETPFVASIPVLRQNYPNPFNPSTTLSFSLPMPGTVQLNIYNLKGQLVKTLYRNQWLASGNHSLIWDGTDEGGNSVASGIYLSRLKMGKYLQSKKMVLAK